MLKSYGVVKRVSSIIGDVAEGIVFDLIRSHPEGLKGREEEFTSQLRSEFDLHILERIRASLNDRTINGIRFNIYTYTKKQESNSGADLAGILNIDIGGQKIIKAYLAQSKVGGNFINSSGQVIGARCYSRELPKQIKDMLKITSDSFVFIYTQSGIYTFSALQPGIAYTSSINTKKFFYRSFSEFYSDFFKCFVGDHKIASFVEPADLPSFAEAVDAKSVLMIRASSS